MSGISDYIDQINESEGLAFQNKGCFVFVESGLYVVFAGGKFHWVEHVTSQKGFARDEWTVSTGNDLHHDQYPTFKDAKEAIIQSSGAEK